MTSFYFTRSKTAESEFNRPTKCFQTFENVYFDDRHVKKIEYPFYGQNNTLTCYVSFYGHSRRKKYTYKDIRSNIPIHNKWHDDKIMRNPYLYLQQDIYLLKKGWKVPYVYGDLKIGDFWMNFQP